MKNLVHKFNYKGILVCLLFYITMFWVINVSPLGIAKLLQITGGTNILDFELGYSIDKTYTTFSNMGSNGREFYLHQIIPIDFIFPISYMMFYFSIIAYSLKKQIIKGRLLNKLWIVPVAAMVFDWAENITIMIMLSSYPKELITVCSMGNIFTIIKFIFIILSVTIIIILLFLLFLKFVFRQRTKQHIKEK